MLNFQRDMRRIDKKIDDISLIHSILKKAMVLRLALCCDNQPYIVPLNFVFDENQGENGVIYLHSALKGLKIDILLENGKVCFEVEHSLELVKDPLPCNWGMRYLSVIGYGEAYFEKDIVQKKRALDLFMSKYSSTELMDSNTQKFEYDENSLASTCLLRIEIASMTGKKSGY